MERCLLLRCKQLQAYLDNQRLEKERMMKCPYCGTAISNVATFCSRCGHRVGRNNGRSKRFGRKNIIVMVAIFCATFIMLAVLGVFVIGIIVYRNMEKVVGTVDDDREVYEASEEADHLSMLVLAVEAYHIDFGAYPAGASGSESMNAPQPSFRRAGAGTHTLTSPIAYLLDYPEDPYAPGARTYNYYTQNESYVIWSPGPDGMNDISTDKIQDIFSNYNSGGEDRRLAVESLCNLSYDPTNGSDGAGDILKSNIIP